jgi:hypothetical protein
MVPSVKININQVHPVRLKRISTLSVPMPVETTEIRLSFDSSGITVAQIHDDESYKFDFIRNVY